MVRSSPPRKVTYFEPVLPRLPRNTVIESTFEVGSRFRCTVQRRRRWSAEEKARIVQETYAPGMSVSLVARQHGVAPNQVFKWRQLYAEGALSAVGAGEEVVAAKSFNAIRGNIVATQEIASRSQQSRVKAMRTRSPLSQPTSNPS